MKGQSDRCKIVVVRDMKCGKMALLQELCPYWCEDYTVNFEIDKCAFSLTCGTLWVLPTMIMSGPWHFSDSDSVLIYFDISQPEMLDSVLRKWQRETQEFCPNAKVVLVGCKLECR